MLKKFSALLFAFFFAITSFATQVDDWNVTLKGPKFVFMYANVKAIGPALFEVDAQTIFAPDVVKHKNKPVYKVVAHLQVNCLTRKIRITGDETYGMNAKVMDGESNRWASKDFSIPQRGSNPWFAMMDICGPGMQHNEA